MKITCTQLEKDWLIDALMNTETPCFFETTGTYINCENCKKCLNEKIEWEIKDGEL